MTRGQLEGLISRTENAITTTENLKRQAEQRCDQLERQQQEHETKSKVGLMVMATNPTAGAIAGRNRDQHQKAVREIENQINRIKKQSIPRFDGERSKLRGGLGKLQMMRGQLDGMLREAESWENSLRSVMDAVSREKL